MEKPSYSHLTSKTTPFAYTLEPSTIAQKSGATAIAISAHEGGYIGFGLQIDDLLTKGENFIAVRVITLLITRDIVIDGLGCDDMLH